MYHTRGLSALSEELKITKAPRKTLAKIIDWAEIRYAKTALLYDEFGHWLEIEPDLRAQVVASMTSLRWRLKDSAVLVIMAAPGEAPELEETLAGGRRIEWHFSNLVTMQENPDALDACDRPGLDRVRRTA